MAIMPCMGRRQNGKLVATVSSRSKFSSRPISVISPRPPLKTGALKRVLESPVMKEIKPVAAKKNASRVKKHKPTKASIKPGKPSRAKPSKKIASGVKVRTTREKIPVGPIKTNDPPQHVIKKPKSPPEPVEVLQT